MIFGNQAEEAMGEVVRLANAKTKGNIEILVGFAIVEVIVQLESAAAPMIRTLQRALWEILSHAMFPHISADQAELLEALGILGEVSNEERERTFRVSFERFVREHPMLDLQKIPAYAAITNGADGSRARLLQDALGLIAFAWQCMSFPDDILRTPEEFQRRYSRA